MKLVKEYIIFEKFTEDSDPIHDLGIGIYINRNFDSEVKAAIWMYEHLPTILNTSKIPYDILFPENHRNIYQWRYFNHLECFLKKYIKIKNSYSVDVLYILSDILRKKGYPKI